MMKCRPNESGREMHSLSQCTMAVRMISLLWQLVELPGLNYGTE